MPNINDPDCLEQQYDLGLPCGEIHQNNICHFFFFSAETTCMSSCFLPWAKCAYLNQAPAFLSQYFKPLWYFPICHILSIHNHECFRKQQFDKLAHSADRTAKTQLRTAKTPCSEWNRVKLWKVASGVWVHIQGKQLFRFLGFFCLPSQIQSTLSCSSSKFFPFLVDPILEGYIVWAASRKSVKFFPFCKNGRKVWWCTHSF